MFYQITLCLLYMLFDINIDFPNIVISISTWSADA